ncbi:3-phosphoshikimate 1-carboxyvinyltransferase [soil metagenome]
MDNIYSTADSGGVGVPLTGGVTMPGDKSISHRAVVLAGLARGRSVLRGVNLGRDVLATCRVTSQLGVRCAVDLSNRRVDVQGYGWDGLREPDDVLDAGNSGTTLRTVLALCAASPWGAVLTGDATLRARPMMRVTVPLRAMGATIDGRCDGDRPPLWVRGAALDGIEWRSEIASAQVKTAVLLAGLRADGPTSWTEPALSRDHTERMLTASGVPVRRSGLTVTVSGGGEPEARDRRVPGDVSAATFLLVAASLIPGSELSVHDVGLNPTRTGALTVLRRMGADLSTELAGEDAGEPYGTVTARHAELRATEIGGEEVATLIDEVPALAVAATQAAGTTVITGAEELRVKESNRIDAMTEGLRRLGADVEARPDGLVVVGPTPLGPGAIDARGDHRIALALAVAGLVSGRRVDIRGWSCVDTSFPHWHEVVAAAQGCAG